MRMKEEFVHFLDVEEALPFVVELAGISYCDGSYRIHRPKSKCMVAEYIISGEGTVILDGKVYHAKAGDIYMLPPGRDQLYYSDAANPWTKIWFNARGTLIDHLLELYDPQCMGIFPDAGGREYIEKIQDIGRNEDYLNREKQEKAAVVFHEFLQYLYGKFYVRKNNYSEETVRLKEYIDKHFMQNIALKDLAEVVYLSESQVIRIFKKDLGVTPYEYILNLKMGQAKLLLRGTRLLVKEIAFQLGFCDEHYFSYVFKQKVGRTPGAYRKEMKA